MARLQLTTAASEKYATIQRVIHNPRRYLDLAHLSTALIISNEEMVDFLKLVRAPEDSDLIIKGGNETIKNEKNNKKTDFLS